MLLHKLALLFIALLFCTNTALTQCADLIVAPDSTGDFTSVQAAIDAAPANGTMPFVIYIKNGVYNEKLFITKSFIMLLGESRDSTILTTAVLRRTWREDNPSDWGVATINIQNGVTDLTVANMTVQNNFADVYPDFPNNNDHTMAIRGGGHRVIIINCNIVATGGDTLSLWNTDGGMFYHNNCFFEGYVDYVAPRGYCYITDSEFFGYNHNASIWHDGSGGMDHKFVIRNSYFDGVQNFALGRYHRDAQFYLLDCFFSENMKNQRIEFVGSDPLQYGKRTYFHNTHRPVFDFSWHKDNIWEAEGSPEPEDITAQWTFNNEWNPEAQLDGLLPFAFLPSPANRKCATVESELSWATGNCAVSHNIYFGTSETPGFITNQTEAIFSPGLLEENTIYYWRVDEVTETDIIEGEVWQFRTEKVTDPTPNPAHSPVPTDSSDYFTRLVSLTWEADKCTIDSFLVYFGSSPDALEFEGIQKYNSFFAAPTDDDSTYYWRIDTKNEFGITEGPVWQFTLNPTVTSTHNPAGNELQLQQNFPNPFSDVTTIQYSLPHSGQVTLDLYDTQGRLIETLFNGYQIAGTHEQQVYLNPPREPAAGLLLCKLRFENVEATILLQHF